MKFGFYAVWSRFMVGVLDFHGLKQGIFMFGPFNFAWWRDPSILRSGYCKNFQFSNIEIGFTWTWYRFIFGCTTNFGLCVFAGPLAVGIFPKYSLTTVST